MGGDDVDEKWALMLMLLNGENLWHSLYHTETDDNHSTGSKEDDVSMPSDDVLVPFLDKTDNRYSVVLNQVGLLRITSMEEQSDEDEDEEHPDRGRGSVIRKNSFEREKRRRRKYRMQRNIFTNEAAIGYRAPAAAADEIACEGRYGWWGTNDGAPDMVVEIAVGGDETNVLTGATCEGGVWRDDLSAENQRPSDHRLEETEKKTVATTFRTIDRW